MGYRPGDPYYKEFTTSNPATGAAANADALPVATANRNGTDDGAFVLTVAVIDTGRYKITGTVPVGYAAGDRLEVSVAATCSGIAGKAVVDSQGIDTKRLSDSLTVGTVSDKTGYSLATAPPTAAAITTAVVAGMAGAPVGSVAATVTATVTDKTGFKLAVDGLDTAKGWGTFSARQTIQAIAQFLFGTRSGVPTSGTAGTVTYTGPSAVAYGTVTVDTAGNITANGLTPPA